MLSNTDQPQSPTRRCPGPMEKGCRGAGAVRAKPIICLGSSVSRCAYSRPAPTKAQSRLKKGVLMGVPTCIYCDSKGPFSEEHVVPAGLGGDDRDWLLKDCVCAKCNTTVF